jgi:predicted nucleic acid-binding protein
VSDAVVYLDSSALLKLIFAEPETTALTAFLEKWPTRVSSALARIEVTRIAARVPDPIVQREARRVLRGVHLIRIDDDVIVRAATIGPPALRSLDAIHLAAAQSLGSDLAGIVVYDRRLARAADEHGITVWSPA